MPFKIRNKPESVKLNGFAMAMKPPALTLVGTSSQEHDFGTTTRLPGQPDLESVIAVPISGGAEFPKYI